MVSASDSTRRTAASAMAALELELPDDWSMLAVADSVVCAPITKSLVPPYATVIPRAISFNLSDGSIQLELGNEVHAEPFSCLCASKSCCCLSGAIQETIGRATRAGTRAESNFASWTEALKLFVVAVTCTGWHSAKLEEAQQADPTYATGRSFSLKRRLNDDGSSRTGYTAAGCALFMLDPDDKVKGGKVRSTADYVAAVPAADGEEPLPKRRLYVCKPCLRLRVNVQRAADVPVGPVGKHAPKRRLAAHRRLVLARQEADHAKVCERTLAKMVRSARKQIKRHGKRLDCGVELEGGMKLLVGELQKKLDQLEARRTQPALPPDDENDVGAEDLAMLRAQEQLAHARLKRGQSLKTMRWSKKTLGLAWALLRRDPSVYSLLRESGLCALPSASLFLLKYATRAALCQ